MALHLYHRTGWRKTVLPRLIAQMRGQAVVIDMDRLAAVEAHEKNAVMLAAGLGVGEIGVGAFHPSG